MTEPKHTPGSWQAGLNIPAVANNNPDPRLIWAGSMLIGDCRSKWVSAAEAAANARLMAAAPELLEATKLAVAAINDLSTSNPGFLGKLVLQDYAQWDIAMAKLRTAIAKATNLDHDSEGEPLGNWEDDE